MQVIDPISLRQRIVMRSGAVSVAELYDLLALGPSGAMGYVLEAIDPERVIATPHESADDGRLLLLQLCERQAAWITAQSMTLTQSFAQGALKREGKDRFAVTRSTVVSEVAMTCGLSEDSADAKLGTAALLSPTGLLADTHAALSRGHLTPWVARALADATWELTPEQILEIQRQVLPRLIKPINPDTGVGCPKGLKSSREAIARVIARVAPERARQRRERAHQERGVKFRLLPESGLMQITAWLPIDKGIAAWDDLESLAQIEQVIDEGSSDPDKEVRTINQCRADVFVRAFAHLLDTTKSTGSMPATCGTKRRVGVLIDLPTLMALREGAGEIPGYGPIDPELARILAEDAEWQRFIHEPLTSELLDLGHKSYTPSVRLRSFINARDPQCTFPGCSRRSHRSQLDHIQPWPQGPTDRANLHPLCVHHHNLKTHGNWRVTRDPATGETHWQSPHGMHARSPNYFSEFVDPPPR